MVDVSSQNNSVSINVSSSGNSASIKASPDTAQYYSEKSREWAISNRIVDGVDYSSKYYAQQSGANAQKVVESENNVKEIYNTLLEESSNISDGIREVGNETLTNIETVKSEAIDSINNTKTTILNDIEFVADGEKKEIEDLADIIKENAQDIANRTSFAMFDTILKDHVLTYEESKGLALQGTYVYKEAVAGSRYGYPDFYAKCLEEYKDSENQKQWLKSNVTKVGSLTDDNGVLSGFNSTSWATLPNNFSPNSSNWEMFFKFTTGTIGTRQNIICSSQLAYQPVDGYIDTDGCFVFAGHLNNTSTTIFAIKSTTVLKSGTTYYVKCEYDSNAGYSLKLGTDKDNLTLEGNSTVTTTINNGYNIVLGADFTTNGAYYDYAFSGTIDLKDSYININSECWWTGANTAIKNPNGHIFYDISQKDEIDDIFTSTGMAWMYGVDEENERIFLPRNNFFDQATGDISGIGLSVEAGLPNINASFGNIATYSTVETSGAVTSTKQSTRATEGYDAKVAYTKFTFDASLSNSIYGNSDTVQPNAVKKLLYICVGNTVTVSTVTDVVDVTTTENDTLPLLHHISADELLENPSWLRSAGQWNDGNVYTTVYNYLVNEYQTGSEHTDTLKASDGTEYTVTYRTNKGKKVVDVANVSQVDMVYSAIGSAWYYVIDQDNMTFRLPMSHNSECYTSDPTRLGLDISAGLPNIEGSIYDILVGGNTTHSGALKFTKGGKAVPLGNLGFFGTAYIDASLSSPIYGNSNTVTPPHTEFYLYFKVANAVQNLELLDVGEVMEAVADKISRQDCVAYITETYQNGNSWYRVYSDGWCEQGGTSTSDGQTVTFLKPFSDTNYAISGMACETDTSAISSVAYLNKKTTSIQLYGKRVNAAGFASGAHPVYWQVSGYIA